MAVRQLRRFDDEIFHKASKPVAEFNERLWELLGDMLDTIVKTGGYGCAAVHVGVLRRAVVINDQDGVIELINPVIVEASEETECLFEGSIAPGAPLGYVERPKAVKVEAFDRNGQPVALTGEGFLAATLCHEIDHLDGVLFTEKAVRIVRDPEEAKRIISGS